MEEEKKIVNNDTNNTNNSTNFNVNTPRSDNGNKINNNQADDVNSFSTTSSPIKEAASNIGGAILEGDRYKSRRSSMNFNNTSDTSNTSNTSNTPNTPNTTNNSSLPNSNNLNKNIMPNNMRSPYNRGNKANSALNMGKNVVSNLHPALKAINMANNIKNTMSSVMPSNNDIMTDSSDDNGPNLSEDGVTTSILGGEEQSEDNASNPISSILGSKNKVSGRFSFLGRLPAIVKIGIALFGSLIPIIMFIMVPILVVSYFSSFWGLDRVLASNGISSSGGSGSISYGDYTLSSSGDQILHTSIDSFLASKGSSLEEFNNLITSNVNDAGFGTRAGVVAAAVTLIGELGDNYNVKVPYFWGGGHGRVADGVVANWGSNECHTYANGTSYNYCGLDCSGFVSWAIYNGGYNMYPMSSGSFSNLAGAKKVNLKNSAVLQPGDLLDSNGHVILVVDIDEESKEYICAEASGNTTGVLFSRHPFNVSGYWGVDLEGFYKTEARS